jgi:hypothetical protein
MPSLNAAFETLLANYPRRDKKDPSVYQYVDQAMAQFGSGTPCCVQMSQALNMSGLTVPSASNRRSNVCIQVNGAGSYYLGAVDEVIDFLTNKCPSGFAGEVVNQDDTGNSRDGPAVQSYLQGRQGILCFSDLQFGAHTELWDGHDIVQQDMNRGWCFSQPQILFWDAGPPLWLTNALASS